MAKHLGKVPSLVIGGGGFLYEIQSTGTCIGRIAVNRKLNKSATLNKNPCFQQSVLHLQKHKGRNKKKLSTSTGVNPVGSLIFLTFLQNLQS